MDASDRKGKSEGCASPRRAVYVDASGMFLYDSIADRKTEARALSNFFSGEERIVNLLDIIPRDPHAGVVNLDDDFRILLICRYVQLSSVRHCIFGIEEEVHKNLLQLPGMTDGSRKRRVELEMDVNIALFELMLQQRKSVHHQTVEVDFFEIGVRETGEVQEIVNDV